MTDFLCDIANRQAAALQKYGITAEEPTEEPITLADAQKHCRVDVYETGSPPETVSDDDTWLTEIGIPAAREYCEVELGRALAPRDVLLVTSAFPSVTVDSSAGAALSLPFGPVQSITSVKYLDQAAADAAYDEAYQDAYDTEFGNSGDEAAADAAGIAAGDIAAAAALEQTLASTAYELDAVSVPARLILTDGSSWPSSSPTRPDSVRVSYVTGYSIPGESPQVYALPRLARAAMLVMLAYLYEHRGDESMTPPALVEALLSRLPGRERMGFA